MQITKTDVIWNYGATFLKIASSALLLPFILRMMPSETVGIWTVFMTITAFASLLDFGFGSSFTRNVTYVFSGVKNFKINGFETVDKDNLTIDFGLLKGVISAMRWFYSRMAIVLFFILATLGTYYIYILLQNYKGEQQEVYIAWILLCLISTYNLYTLYYDSLLQGKGLIKRSKQIVIIGQTVYLITGTILIMTGNGLVAIIAAQAISVIIIRWFSYRSFFTGEIKLKLHDAIARSQKEIIKAITPNSLKIGITSLGAFMVQRSAIVIGSLYLSLSDIASYGITIQLISVIAAFAGIYIATYQPKIVQLRIVQNNFAIKELYLKGQLLMTVTYIIGGLVFLFFGQWVLNIIGSKTKLLSMSLIAFALILSFVETIIILAAGILLSKNEVPFFKAAIVSGLSIVFGLLLLFQIFKWGVLILILIPFVVDISYQAWKWPLEVKKELGITLKDVSIIINKTLKQVLCLAS